MRIDNSRLDYGESIGNPHIKYPVHPRQDDHDAAAYRQASSRQTCTRAAREKGCPEAVTQGHDFRNVTRVLGKDCNVGLILFYDISVTFVNGQFGLGTQNAVGAEQTDERLNQCLANSGHYEWGLSRFRLDYKRMPNHVPAYQRTHPLFDQCLGMN
jgi:hypothetical protein